MHLEELLFGGKLSHEKNYKMDPNPKITNMEILVYKIKWNFINGYQCWMKYWYTK